PGSAAEAKEVRGLWLESAAGRGAGATSALTLVGPEATETALREHAPGHRILHIATHGFLVQEGRFGSAPGVSGNPFLLSGLALAGANQRNERSKSPGDAEGDDGILTAEEIASLDLRGVEWAVLSACETGIGPIQEGEGVLGLRRAFEVAGAG